MSEGQPGRGRWATMVVIALIAVLIFASVIISQHLHNAAVIQDCVASGRTNCAPIEPGKS